MRGTAPDPAGNRLRVRINSSLILLSCKKVAKEFVRHYDGNGAATVSDFKLC